jgi:hypothetical protein
LIQEGLDDNWPSSIKEAIEPFKQGHLIPCPPVFYAAVPEHGIWTPSREVELEAGESSALIDLHPEDRPPYGLITSQSCEVVEERDPPLQPWVQIAPVYKVGEDSKLLVRDFIARLDPPDLEDGPWVVDLRIEMPVEKSLLVGVTPIEAFGEDAGYEELGRKLGYRRGRPALHGVFHELFGVTMGQMKTGDKPGRKRARRVREQIYKLALKIESGTKLQPQAAGLYIVTAGSPDAEAKELFDEWWDLAREVGKEHGLELLPNRWLDADNLEISLAEYEQLIEIRNPLY